jgi:hypothetical protein
MKLAVCILASFSLTAFAQESADTSVQIKKNWESKAVFGLNGNQSSFINWNAGGRNNISLLGFFNGQANYNKGKLKWNNNLDFALGGLQYIGVGTSDDPLQKTDDRIDLSSEFGHQIKEKFYGTLMTSFKTQSLPGFNYPNDSVVLSRFMAPGYVNIALGINYTKSKHLAMFISPINAKMTFVRDQTLANAGAFGVRPAEYSLSTGELLQQGEKFRFELGALYNLKFNKDIFENINLIASLNLFSNYLDRPQNIDVNTDLLFTFKVNSWFSASFNMAIIYDHDINIRDNNGNTGPRTQYKSVLGAGISYTLKNTK